MPNRLLDDTYDLNSIMEQLLNEADKSLPIDVPVACAIYKIENKKLVLISSVHNTREKYNDPTNHAEIIAIREATKILGDWRLDKCILFSTLEPCIMCAGTLVQSRIGAVVFGAYDEQYGACGSIYNFLSDPRLNHNASVIGGVLEVKCTKKLKDFFNQIRK
jgi:tRNA(adenine34) deaminase